MDFGKIEYTAEQVKEIKEFFKENDITANSSLDADIDISPDKADIFNRTKTIFAQYWKDNLKSLGINKSMKNFSNDYPAKLLMNTDINVIGEVTSEYDGMFNKDLDYSQTNINEIFDTLTEDEEEEISEIFQLYRNEIDVGLNKYAKSVGKDVSELSNEEILFVYDKVFDVINTQVINALMIGQQVPELYDISHKNAVIEDFNENQKENHPKIDFLRKQYGLRRKFDSILSFDELAEEDLVNLNCESDFEQISDEEINKAVAAFIDTLDDVERTIYFMKQDGCAQEEIAKALGYKTHSAVTKRLAKMKEKAIRYCESIDF